VIGCALAAGFGLTIGCNGSKETPKDTEPAPAKDDAAKTFDTRYAAVDKQVGELKTKAEKATGEEKAKLDARLKDATAKRDAAKKKVDELKAVAADKLDAARKEAEAALEDARKAIQE
jgi:hypothetical protein